MAIQTADNEPDGVPIGEDESLGKLLVDIAQHLISIVGGMEEQQGAQSLLERIQRFLGSAGDRLTERVMMDVVENALVIMSPKTGEVLITIDATGKVVVPGDVDEAAQAFWDRVYAYAKAINEDFGK